jgi:hypothetical protein
MSGFMNEFIHRVVVGEQREFEAAVLGFGLDPSELALSSWYSGDGRRWVQATHIPSGMSAKVADSVKFDFSSEDSSVSVSWVNASAEALRQLGAALAERSDRPPNPKE